MKFFPLMDVLNSIAICIEVDPAESEHPLLTEAYKSSCAASRLDQLLHNSPETRPKIFDKNLTGLPRHNDEAYQDLFEILLYMAPWINRSFAAYMKWQEDMKQNGMTRDNILPPIEMYFGKFKNKDFKLRADQISFEECEIINLLEENNIQHTLAMSISGTRTEDGAMVTDRQIKNNLNSTGISADTNAKISNKKNEIQDWQVFSFEICKLIRAANKKIKKKDLARKVNEKLREQGVTGRGGKIISMSSILRHGIK